MKLDSIKIRLILVQKQMTQTDLAERCGIARQNISLTLSRGTCSPSKAAKLADALGVPAREIIKEE